MHDPMTHFGFDDDDDGLIGRTVDACRIEKEAKTKSKTTTIVPSIVLVPSIVPIEDPIDTTSPTRARALRYWYQPVAARDLIAGIADGNERIIHAIAHLLYGTLAQNVHNSVIDGIDVSVAVPAYAWREMGISPDDIDTLGILRPGWKRYQHGEGLQGQCRQFTLDPAFVLRVLGVALRNIDGAWCNVIDGRVSTTRKFESVKKPGATSGRPRATARAEINWENAKGIAYDMLRKAEAVTSGHHRHRAIQAIRCLLAIRASDTFRMSTARPGFASYVPVYHQVSCGGRWYERKSGFQGLPGVVKAALIEGTSQVNYDLRACHVAAAVALAGEINAHAAYVDDAYMLITGMDATPAEKAQGILGVRDLLKTKRSYDLIADAVGLPRSVVKMCVIAVLYGGNAGAWVDLDREGRAVRSTAVMEALMQHHSGDIRAARKSHRKLFPKLRLIMAFASGLITAMTTTMTNPTWFRRCRGRLRQMMTLGNNGNVTNAIRTTIMVPTRHDTPHTERRAAARRTLSHILTGIEQDAIQFLLQSCRDHNVTVLHLEHDGLIVGGSIPQACIDDMKRDSLLASYAQLDIKAFPGHVDGDPLDSIVAKILIFTPTADTNENSTTVNGEEIPRPPNDPLGRLAWAGRGKVC